MAKKNAAKPFSARYLTFKKAVYCLLRPWLWRCLGRGVAPTIEHRQALSRFAFRTIVDVGANRGQFTSFVCRQFPKADIYAFEPLREPAKIFKKIFAGEDRIHFFANAVGDKTRNANIYITTRDDSSSLLRPASMQNTIFNTEISETENVLVKKLSEQISYTSLQYPALLKIDVQGSELDVLLGSADLLHAFDVIYVECSYIAIYEDQPLFAKVDAWLNTHGFALAGVFNQHNDPKVGAVQADFLFTRAASTSYSGSIT